MSENLIDLAHFRGKGNIFLMRGDENILGLQSPGDFSCSISSYITSHKIMKIWIHEKGKAYKGFFVHLTSVDYFSGFTDWSGANFKLLTDKDGITFMRQIKRNINGVIAQVDCGEYKIYLSCTEFKLELANYIPPFIDSINIK